MCTVHELIAQVSGTRFPSLQLKLQVAKLLLL